MARKYDIPFVSSDYREVIDKGDLNALLVVTPDDTHYPITMDALNAGLHVLCEKPLAFNAKQAKEMYEKAEEVGVKHMTFFTFRWPRARVFWAIFRILIRFWRWFQGL